MQAYTHNVLRRADRHIWWLERSPCLLLHPWISWISPQRQQAEPKGLSDYSQLGGLPVGFRPWLPRGTV